jgi:hypothetical protein
MVLSAWVDSAWYYRRGWTVHGVIGVGGQCMMLSAWVNSAWCYRAWVDDKCVIEVGGR